MAGGYSGKTKVFIGAGSSGSGGPGERALGLFTFQFGELVSPPWLQTSYVSTWPSRFRSKPIW